MSASVTYRARWVFPAEGEPLDEGRVECVDGRIVGIHQRSVPGERDLGNVALVPRFVNAHTHLELSDVSSPLTPSAPFTAWITAILAHRRDRASHDGTAAEGERLPSICSRGVRECVASGTGVIADIVGPGWSPADYSTGRPTHTAPGDPAPIVFEPDGSDVTVVACLELIGLSAERVAEQLARARQHLLPATGGPSVAATEPHVVRALSPHAPYSVHPDLLHGAVNLAVETGCLLATHVAETEAELELLARGGGEFVEFLQRLGVWNPAAFAAGTRPLDVLRVMEPAPRVLVVHGNYLDDEALRWLAARPQFTLVYCPRTHSYFGHTPHPFQRLLALGGRVAIGTDSRASNPNLSMFDELRWLAARVTGLTGPDVLRLGTSSGAVALGLPATTVDLTPGNPARWATIALPHHDSTNPWQLLWSPESRVVESTECE